MFQFEKESVVIPVGSLKMRSGVIDVIAVVYSRHMMP